MKRLNKPSLRSQLIAILNNPKLKKDYINFTAKVLFKYTGYNFACYATPPGIFSSVIDKITEGNYTWNPNKILLKKFIYYRIRTEVSDLAKKERKWRTVSLDLYSDLIHDENDDNISNLPLPHNMIFDEQEKNRYPVDPEIVRKEAFKLFPRSTMEYPVLKGIYDSIKTEKLIDKLGITINEFYKIRLRIIRELRKWYEKRKKEKAFALNLIIPINIIMEVFNVYIN